MRTMIAMIVVFMTTAINCDMNIGSEEWSEPIVFISFKAKGGAK